MNFQQIKGLTKLKTSLKTFRTDHPKFHLFLKTVLKEKALHLWRAFL